MAWCRFERTGCGGSCRRSRRPTPGGAGSGERCIPGTDLWMGDHSYSWVTLDELTDRTGSEDSSFWPWVDSVLAPLGKQYGPENVRIVFGFDS